MKAVRTFSFLAIFLAVGITFVYFKFQAEEKKIQLEELAKSQVLLPNSISDEVNYLSFDRPGNPAVVIKKVGQVWNVVAPVKTQADQMVVKGIIASLRFGKKEEIFDSEESSEAYGFKSPAMKLIVGTSKSSKKAALVLGNKAPLKNLFYAKWDGGAQVFLISPDLWKAFDRNLLSLRRRLIFNFDPEEVRGFQISYADKVFDIVRKGGAWVFSKNSGYEDKSVEPALVDAYIEILRSTVAGEFLDGGDWKEDRWGIKFKQNYVNVYFEKEKPQILYLGYPARELNATYVHMDKIFDLALVHSKLAKRLESGPESFIKSDQLVIEK